MKNGKPHVHGKLFSDIHSCIEKEWEGREIFIPDDAGVASARSRLDGSYRSVMDLVSALCFQLRYKESLQICESLYKDYPSDYALQRRLGVLYFKLLEFKKSEKFFKACLKDTQEELQILYLLAVVNYYKGDYAASKRLLERCAPLCADCGEMFVSVLYWHACCLARLDRPLDDFFSAAENYRFDCGHHAGYDAAVRFALKRSSENEAVESCEGDTELNRCCLYYGLSVLFERKDKIKSNAYLQKALSAKDLFGAFSYIAGYVDFHRNI